MFTITRTAALLAGLLLASATLAQPAPDYDGGPDSAPSSSAYNASDPPSRVARLALIHGAVSFVPAGENDWVEAQINRPLITGDKLWTDRGARAELQIGSSAIRLDEQSSFNFLNLDDNTAQVELTQGTLNLRVRRLYSGQTYEVDTPSLAFVINRVGEYRIDIAPDGHGTTVTAFHGGGDAYGEAGARFRIEEGQSVRFNDPQLRDYASNNIPSADNFDRFCFDRDGRWDNSRSRRYVSEDVIGYDDLDSYGNWNSEPDYGSVWYPSQVAVGWTPYSYGHWGWVGAYGWTWIDSSPWGFAPFHYGRWAYIHNRWGWCPGPLDVRPYYAPALVAFIGGGGLRVGFSTGAPVGWFPLGLGDVYVPGYPVSRDYFTRVNVNNTVINNVTINNYYGNYSRGNFDYSRVNYANRNIASAVTAVPGNVFVGAREIRGSAIAVNRETFANARVSGFAAVAPTRASLAFEGGRRAAVAPPQAIANRNIIAATRPPAPVASFAQRESQLQRDPGRALPVNQLRVGSNAPGDGQRAQRADRSARPNVNVVTTNGQPARSPAPAIMPRNPVNPSQVENGRGPALRGNPQEQQGNGVESRAVAGPQNGRPPATTQERGPATRYVNPNAQDQNARDNGRATLNNQRSVTPGNAPQDANANRNVQRDNEAQQREQQAGVQQRQLQRGQDQERQQQQQQRAQQEQQAQERTGRQQQVDQQRQLQRGQDQERQQQQQRAQQEQQAQERTGRQQQVDQQRAQQQQAQAQQQQMQERAQQQQNLERQQQQQQQRAQQEQQAQERAARQQQVDQQRAQQQQAQQREQAQQQQMQERQAQQQVQQQRAQQQQQVQERAAQQQQQAQERAAQQQAQQQRAQQQPQPQQQQQQQQQGRERARVRDDSKDKDANGQR